MSGSIDLHVSVVLKHILERGPEILSREKGEQSENWKEKKKKKLKGSSKIGGNGAELLDFSGPKLITGIKNWLLFYQLVGQINWIGAPLYVSIVYKLTVVVLLIYNIIVRYLLKLYNLHLVKESFRNPIFLFISFLACATFTVNMLITLYVNLFDLCPLFKILTTPKLCFARKEVLHIIGTRSLKTTLIMHLYNTLLLSLLLSRDFKDYFENFNLATFMLDYYLSMVFTYYVVGLTHMDLYIRSAFGHWLLALKSHLEYQFTYLHRQQRRSLRSKTHQLAANEHLRLEGEREGEPRELPLRLITFDEVQKNLNHMDDHLEVLRSVQVGNIVLMTLNAFLANGALFLLTYHMIADQSNYYHGCLLLLISANYIVAIFFGYSGDRWVYYALSSFVQTVEDEYFMQSNIKTALSEQEAGANASAAAEVADSETGQIQQLLLIKKKDVLFCREFLHQFENHLATPWSKLTLKSHLHMLRTFVTLVAAQIIFDNEH